MLGGTVDLNERLQHIWDASNEAVVQPLIKLASEYWAHEDKTALYVVIAAVIGFVVGRGRRSRKASFQNRGEELVSEAILSNFTGPDYHLMNHVTLNLEGGTTQIDHILVSRFGIFVIETKDYSGWIFASAKRSRWTQVLFQSKFGFQNPIFQNQRHVKAVSNLLDFLPSETIKSVVIFVGDAEFKTDIPPEVFSLGAFIRYLREETTELMSLNRVQFCVGRLETARLAISGETDVRHIEHLRSKHGNFY